MTFDKYWATFCQTIASRRAKLGTQSGGPLLRGVLRLGRGQAPHEALPQREGRGRRRPRLAGKRFTSEAFRQSCFCLKLVKRRMK